MRNISILVLTGLLVASCATTRPDGAPPTLPAASVPIWLNIGLAGGEIRRLPLDAYVTGTILAEASLAGLDEATALRVAQVQAVLGRTYALANRERHDHDGFDLCATTHCQVYADPDQTPGRLAEIATRAVRSTTGVVVTFSGAPINAVFHANCGGHTSDARAVWRGGNPPYLRGRPDAYCQRRAGAPWTFDVADDALASALAAHPDTDVGPRLDRIVVTARDPAGRAVQIRLDGSRSRVVRGEQLRAAVVARFGVRSVKSTHLSVDRSVLGFRFRGRGFGHGVGLCQIGATARAQAGHSPEQILRHYYPGTSLTTLPNGPRHTQ